METDKETSREDAKPNEEEGHANAAFHNDRGKHDAARNKQPQEGRFRRRKHKQDQKGWPQALLKLFSQTILVQRDCGWMWKK